MTMIDVDTEFIPVKDTQKLLKIFPEEIWEAILEEVKDAKDQRNVNNASLFFRRLLLSKRVLFLFPEVWQILDVKYYQDPAKPKTNICTHYCDCDTFSCWSSFHCINWWKSATFNFRLICKTWCRAVDDFLQELHGRFKVDNRDELICTTHGTFTEFSDKNLEKITACLQHFQGTHSLCYNRRSPFVSKSITLNFESEENQCRPELPQELYRLLSDYGIHIWYLYIIIRAQEHFSLSYYYIRIRKVLEVLPNLKVLQLSCGHNSSYKNNSEILREMQVNPLPTLPNLQTISISKAFVQILEELIGRNNHISVLKFGGSRHNEFSNIHNYPFTNLKRLSLNICDAEELIVLANNQHIWKLTRLDISFENAGFIEWSRIFIQVEKLCQNMSSLTTLALELPEADDENNRERNLLCPDMSLKLSGTVNLKLVMEDLSSLDFIFPMRQSLEYLDITVNYDVNKKQKQRIAMALEHRGKIKLLSYSDRLLESNIWDLFPKLEKVIIIESIMDVYRTKTKNQSTRREWRLKN